MRSGDDKVEGLGGSSERRAGRKEVEPHKKALSWSKI